MAKIVIFLLYFGLITVRICGQMNSDPAPGRSPGPPGLDTLLDAHDPGSESSGTILLTKDDEDDFVDRTSNNLNAKTSDDSKSGGPSDYFNSDLDKFDKFAKSRARKSGRICKNPIAEFLSGVDEMVALGKDNETLSANGRTKQGELTGEWMRNDVDIKMEIVHELFDTQAGVTCGLMYKVRLSTSATHLGEFAVETTSNGRPRGSFIGRSLGNKLPMSWFKTHFVDDINWSPEDGSSTKGSSSFEVDGDDGDGDEDDDDGDDDDDGMLLAADPNESNENVGKWTDEANFLDEEKLRASECSDNQWVGRHTGSSHHAVALWMVNEFCDREETLQFRVIFRPLANDSSSPSSRKVAFEKTFNHKVLKDCELVLKEPAGSLDYTALPLYSIDCVIHFPSFEEVSFSQPPPGILIELLRLNVPCDSGSYIKFSAKSILCGKLEELSVNERTHHFDVWQNSSVRIYKNPMFSLRYKIVDYCYNLTLKKQSGAFFIKPTRRDSLECFFRVHLPYGNKIELQLVTNNRSEVLSGSDKYTHEAIFTKLGLSAAAINVNFSEVSNHSTSNNIVKPKPSPDAADIGFCMHIFDSDQSRWSHCINGTSQMQAFSLQSTSNTLTIHLFQHFEKQSTPSPPPSSTSSSFNEADFFHRDDAANVPSVFFSYGAVAVPELVSDCAFGWIAIQQFCVAAVEVPSTWHDAELHCVNLGGHLASIRTELEQNVMDQMLLNSPGYQDHFAYWVGGSDKNFEGDFRWTDSLPFQYTNWFPGWSQHGHYNKQPNDDGLSSQDCIELRRYFRTPPGVQSTRSPLSSRFMWNDRDCSAKNFLICERPMNNDIFQKNWVSDCNKTVSLTKEHPRAAVWSPSFPRPYPDNANCFTTITAPTGYRIVLEFEELVIETEPGCTYDYLEITEPSSSTHANLKSTNNYESRQQKSSRHNSNGQHPLSAKPSQQSQPRNVNNNFNSNSNSITKNNSNNVRNFRKRSSYENLSLSYTSATSIHSDNNTNSRNIAQLNYQNILNLFTNLYKPRSNVLIQTPDYPKGNPFFHLNRHREAAIPRRLCGDWSSKLKLLRHVTMGSYLGLHFVSDYSHHFGGFKAKAFMENTASECSDERLKPYNGSCYLFVSYPEVDWSTAQQVCRGVGAQLASVSSADEHKFISTNIRNQLDYSPQLIYWLGAELEKSGKFEWTDDSEMKFEGWLPGQGYFDELPKEDTCLGLQWKMSPTPMLPSGLYWESQKCKKVGGYVCKKQQQLFHQFELNNETVTGTEGRLTSPGYPNSYPLNVDYWIRIKAPERTRVIVQFQKIDLEPQDECLYDYISVQNYDMVSKIALEPGTNAIPMAMFTSEKTLTQTQYQNERILYARRIRSLNGNGWTRQRHTGGRAPKMQIRPDTPDGLDTSSQQSESPFSIGSRWKDIKRFKRGLPVEPSTPHDDANRILNRRSFAELRGAENAQSFLPYVRWCGSHDSNMSKFDFISSSNEVVLNFRSDYSVSSGGFAAVWKAIDISGCPLQTLTSHEGSVTSSNYPHFLINNLNCTYVIQAPTGRKIWLEFTDFELLDDSVLELDIGHGVFQPFRIREHVNEGIFVSFKEQIKIQIRTGQRPRGKGFRAFYRTVGSGARERIIPITNNATGFLYHLNYPHNVAESVDYTQHLVAPLGHIILLELNGVEFTENGCADKSVLEVYDNYADNNGTKWQLCKFQNNTDGKSTGKGYVEPHAPVYITSYLNTLHIRQRTTSESNISLNATVRIQQDTNYKLKLASGDDVVESCQPNPCQFRGKCVTNNGRSRCQCHGHFVGRFCGLTLCELEPCLFGTCELTPSSFKCHCQRGYKGPTCEQKQRPCAENPCEGRGICMEKNGGFFCRCHAWWEGQKCERRMMNIPYKPLSERMLQEPFWLGLITVFVVLAVIGLVWCAKRHFPEKIEKLLAEEADRNRPPGSTHGHHHHTSLREQLQFTTSIPQPAVNVAPGGQRSIFNRLGIRKPSILSLSSPNPPGGATARTFSLDDLLRPPLRRSPSPRKKRNNSTPVKKTANDKKQILQQLVSPAAAHAPKVSLDELIQMSEQKVKAIAKADSESDLKETTFSEASCSGTSTSITRPIADPKLEKKVTFARLLSKVSAEMSSGSEVDVGHGTHSSALSLPTDIQLRASSVPPSPCTNDMRSPHSTSSNPGSESLSSSELALTDMGFRKLQAHNSSSNNRRIKSKVSSADSILAMFRNFTSTTAPSASGTTTSVFISPSTTPTASSPQDDLPCDDDTSTTSSMHTPISFSSGAPDSPIFYRQTTIEVPVLDALNAHKSSSANGNMLHPPTILLEIPSNGINKCLSPIREMPTPMPSPALTPIMHRPNRSNSPIFQEDVLSVYSDEDNKSGDHQITGNIFLELHSENTCALDSEVDTTPTDTATTSTASMSKPPKLRLPTPSITIGIEPPSPEVKTPRPRDLVIPTLTVEQPSPTRNRFPMIIFPGSPPPQRASIGETSFMFPNKQQQKRLLKQFEKPTSLDLPFVPPMITITSNMSEMESDIEPMSPAPKTGGTSLLVPPVGMCYLSPFTMCTRADRTISESNLSSSGYSSMASPGPSRCGSSNPLYPNEMDEPGSGHPGSSFSLHANLLHRRKSSVLASCKENVTNGKSGNGTVENVDHLRARSDSETFSDDILLESNDEGIGTDHLDEKLDDAASKIKALETTDLSLIQVEVGEPIQAQMAQLQLPSIVIQVDGVERALSPVSSRSESPLSDRAGMGRFSPHFYGRKDLLPFTDSDGLYDFPSSDGKGATSTHQRRSSSKKRERKSSKTGISQSPTKNQLDVPLKETPVSSSSSNNCSKRCHSHHHVCHNSLSSRKSPKRRAANRHLIASSSSSTESLTTAKSLAVRSAPRSRYTSPNRDKVPKMCDDSEDDIGEALLNRISPTKLAEELSKPKSKIGRLRAIGNQIRFLRRLEKSIKRREKLDSLSDSCAEDNTDELDLDSPKVTSPLLQSPIFRTKMALCRQKRLAQGPYSNQEASPLKLNLNDINSD